MVSPWGDPREVFPGKPPGSRRSSLVNSTRSTIQHVLWREEFAEATKHAFVFMLCPHILGTRVHAPLQWQDTRFGPPLSSCHGPQAALECPLTAAIGPPVTFSYVRLVCVKRGSLHRARRAMDGPAVSRAVRRTHEHHTRRCGLRCSRCRSSGRSRAQHFVLEIVVSDPATSLSLSHFEAKMRSANLCSA